jgi:ssDNA thymidine ADP-ribosyltransferase, DarT
MPELTQENAYIFRITHIDNVPFILANGIHCRSSTVRDPQFHEIGN